MTESRQIRAIRLKTLGDVKRLLARVINDVQHGWIDENTARTIGYLASIIKSVIRDGDFEQRIEDMEAKLKEQTRSDQHDIRRIG